MFWAWHFSEAALKKWALSSLPYPDTVPTWLKDCWSDVKPKSSKLQSVSSHLLDTCLVDLPENILYKSIAGHYRPVRVADGPITACYRFIKNANWVELSEIDVYSVLFFFCTGNNPTKVCELCRGSGEQKCTSSDPHANFDGALRCLDSGGDVAFVRHDSVMTNRQGDKAVWNPVILYLA